MKSKDIPTPRSRLIGLIALSISLLLGGFFIYAVFILNEDILLMKEVDFQLMSNLSFYTLALPIVFVSLIVIGTGFWIGWTILTIKVVPPMPEIVEKRDLSKVQAFFLCLITFSLAAVLLYGVYIKNFWALAIPAAVITLVVLGAVFWVGIAIITTRSTLPDEQQE